jgi:integrase
MPRAGANVYKRKDGRWEGRYIKGYGVKGRAVYGYVYARTCTEVKAKLSKARAEISGSNCHNMTFGDLSSLWLTAARLRVKASTYASYINILYRHILPVLGEYRLDKLTRGVLDNFASLKLTSGRTDGKGGLSPKSVRDMLCLVKSIISYGESEKLIARDSVTVTYPKDDAKEMRVLSRAEQDSLEKVLACNTDLYKFGVMLCLYTGIRIGEVCALRWENISLNNGVISIRNTVQRIKSANGVNRCKTEIIVDTPKSKRSVRDIPFPCFLNESFERFLANSRSAYLLTGKEESVTEPRTLQNKFKSYLKASGLDGVNFHALRHTFATRCIEAGFDVKSLSEILGHSNVNITLNRYVHSSLDQKRAQMKHLRPINDGGF